MIRRLFRDLLTRTRRSGKWRAVRKAHLAQNPTCAACGSTAKLEVHHLMPVHLRPDLELVRTNLLTLCESRDAASINCHLVVGHVGNWHAYNPDAAYDAATMRQRLEKQNANTSR